MAKAAERDSRTRGAGRRKWRRLVLATLAVPPSLAVLFGLGTAYRIYASNREEAANSRFPLATAPAPPQSLLVFAPHCDDETLGAAGLMRVARRAGCPVHAVIFTNGDGFRISAARELRKISVQPADFVRYGRLRQTEARAALGLLGVNDVTFLGYPDRGLMPMWTTNWENDDPFKSAYTRVDHCPYDNAPTPHAPYSGESLLADIKRQMEEKRPTDIYVTHPKDDHPDHAAASVFVRTALEQERAAGAPWAQTARLHYYLVHHGDWPVPQGLHEEFPLGPPAQMVTGDTDWQQLPLDKGDVEAKYAAINRYRSQMHVTGRFLLSFARGNELFGTLTGPTADRLYQVADGRMRVDGADADWDGLLPLDIDPVADSVAKAFQASADITRIYGCRDSEHVYLRIDASERLSRGVRYLVTLRPVGIREPQPHPVTVAVTPRGPAGTPETAGDDATAAWNGRTLEVAIPLSTAGIAPSAGPVTLNVTSETRIADIAIDRTGYRGVPCDSGATPRLASSSSRP